MVRLVPNRRSDAAANRAAGPRRRPQFLLRRGRGAQPGAVRYRHRGPAGQLVVMTGPSGSGKTTLLTLIGALRSLQEGRIEVLGHDLSRLGARAGARYGATSVSSSRCTICSSR